MPTLREAAQQALEALTGVAQWVEMRPTTHPWDAWQRIDPAITGLRTALAQPEQSDIHSCSYYCDRPACIKAQRDEMRERLEKQEQEPVAWLYRGRLHDVDPSDWAVEPVTPLYTHPPMIVSPECAVRGCAAHDDRVDGPGVKVEPVAWLYRGRLHDVDPVTGDVGIGTPQPEQEPMTVEALANALVMSRIIDADAIDDPEGYDGGVMLDRVRGLHRRIKGSLYTHPPQRKPLTDDEVWDAYMEISAEFDCNMVDLVEFARAIERAHGIGVQA